MDSQPSWTALYGIPLIQKRVSIARPPAPAIEDSDVLVLNSRSTTPDSLAVGAQVLYLDLRLSLSSTEPTRVNWAFAGLRETAPFNEIEECAVRYRWRHAIDSHGDDEQPDEGTMVKYKDKNGEVIEIETGVAVDPDTGKMGPYEEVWKSEYIPRDTPFAFLISGADPDQSTKFMAVLGPHAVGLLQTATDGRRHFDAVRLQGDMSKHESGESAFPTFSKVVSTGNQLFDDQLENLAEELFRRERNGKELWKRGERLILGGNRSGESNLWSWTVWDAGHVH